MATHFSNDFSKYIYAKDQENQISSPNMSAIILFSDNKLQQGFWEIWLDEENQVEASVLHFKISKKKKKKFKKEDYVTETIVVPQQLKYLTLYTKKFDRHQWYFHPNRVSLSQTSAETTPSANFSFNLLQP